MKAYYTIAELEAKGIELNGQEIAWAQRMVDEISQFVPCHILAVTYFDSGEKRQYVSQAYCVLDNTSPKIKVHRVSSGGKIEYYFNAFEVDNLPNLSTYDKQRIREAHTRPNSIYKPTVKKIQAHIDYQTAIYNDCLVLSKKKGSEVDAFLKSIEGLPVQWWNNKMQGEIIQNGIILKFEINDGRVSQKIEMYYEVNNTVENFKALANNQYKPPVKK